MTKLLSHWQTSVGRKQIVALTGLLLIGYLIIHLAGNMFIFLGPAAFNHYAEKMASLRPGLYIVEAFLLYVFIVHIWITAALVWQNYKSRSIPYRVYEPSGERSWATRLMPYTGTLLLIFVIWHLMDFTFIDKHGPRSILSDGQSYGLYGVVYNSFASPLNSGFYILAMMAVGFHLSHGVQSLIQTFGFNHPRYTPLIKRISNYFAIFIAFGFSSIPIYVLVQSMK